MKAQTKSAVILSACLLFISVLLTVGVLTFAQPCAAHEDGSWMTCHWAGKAVECFGVLLCIVGALRLLAGEKARISLDAVTFAAALITLRIPGGVIPTCSMASMRCNALTRPVTLVACVLLMALSAVDALLARRKG